MRRGAERGSNGLATQGTNNVPVEAVEALENVYEDIENTNTPPEPSLVRRAASYSDFYHVVKAQISKDEALKRKKTARKERQWEGLDLSEGDHGRRRRNQERSFTLDESLDKQLLETSQEDYSLYRDQLTLTDRHLDNLIDDANSTLKLLTTLSNSFKAVKSQTSTFRSQCEDLLNEQKRLEKLAHDVGTDLHYYQYLDNATRRLNAPGASRMVDDDSFGDMVEDIDSCIVFMSKHVGLGVDGIAMALTRGRKTTVIATPTLLGTSHYSRRPCISWIMASPHDWKRSWPILVAKFLQHNRTQPAMPSLMGGSKR